MSRTYVRYMEWENLSIDQREQRLIAAEHEIEVTARTEDGRLMEYGRTDRTTHPETGFVGQTRVPVCRRRVPKPVSAPSPTQNPLGAGETHRPRQPDHPLLVPPSGGRPRTRLPNRHPRNRAGQIRQTRHPRTAVRLGAGRPRPQPATQPHHPPTQPPKPTTQTRKRPKAML
jgi:hypothetical protein